MYIFLKKYLFSFSAHFSVRLFVLLVLVILLLSYGFFTILPISQIYDLEIFSSILLIHLILLMVSFYAAFKFDVVSFYFLLFSASAVCISSEEYKADIESLIPLMPLCMPQKNSPFFLLELLP